MNCNLRKQVLMTYKTLHRTRKMIFEGDATTLEKARIKINDEYKSKKHVTDMGAISQLIDFAKAVEKELRTTVVQAQEVAPGRYELKINKDTVKMDNIPYKNCESS